jgi:hypothetical protein
VQVEGLAGYEILLCKLIYLLDAASRIRNIGLQDRFAPCLSRGREEVFVTVSGIIGIGKLAGGDA